MLLLGAVAFWWGLIVVPRLVSLAFPELLSLDAIPRHLDPDKERTVANAVSAASLLIVALLAFVMVRQAHHARSYWITTGGWAVLAVTAAVLAWEEVSGFHDVRYEGTLALGEAVLGAGFHGTLWPVLASPLILAFVLAMAVFVSKGFPSTGSAGSWQASSGREIRALLILGLTAWLLAVAYEVSSPFVFNNFAGLEQLLEETLEFSGTLIIGLAAALSLSKGRGRELAPGVFGGRRLLRLALGSMAVVAVLGGFVVSGAVSTYREQLVDTRGLVIFNVSLANEQSLVQEIGVVSAPMARLKLRVMSRDSQDRSGVMLWRVREAGVGGSGPILREGRMEVAARIHPRWENIDFPLLVEAEGRPLAVQLIAEVEPEAHLRIGGTKTNRLEHLQFWINGMKTWPDQNLELVAYGPGELTRSKFQAIWSHFTWSWPVLAGAAIVGLWIITFIPALLVTVARQRL